MSWLKRFFTVRSNLGDKAERQAERYLRRCGLTILARNYRIKSGEIDLIARDGEQLVFVEVRYRSHSDFGSAAASVDWNKQKKLRRAAEHYLQRYNPSEQSPCRFDIVALSPDKPVDWIRNAF